MARRAVARPPADKEFLALPPRARLEFEEVLPSLVRQPFRSGPGFTVQEVRSHPGVWKVKLTALPPRIFRGVYEVDGNVVRFLAFGPRPDFYRKLTHKDRKGRSRKDQSL